MSTCQTVSNNTLKFSCISVDDWLILRSLDRSFKINMHKFESVVPLHLAVTALLISMEK